MLEPILAARCGKLALSGHLGTQAGRLGAILGGISGFFGDLGRDLAKNGRTTKNDDSSSLLQVFEGFRDAFWRLFGNILRHLGAMLGYVEPSWRHLATSWRKNGAQDRQDEPRERTIRKKLPT